MEDHCDRLLKALRRGVEERLGIFPQMVNLFFDQKINHKLMIKGYKNKRNLIAPAVTLKANGTATLHAAAIKRIEVNASHCRDGRSHSALMVKNN